MGLIEFINNKFLFSLYSNEALEGALLGNFSVDFSGQLSMSLHVENMPKQEVKKWGIWKHDYDVIVIKLIAQGIEGISVNCQRIKSFQLSNVSFEDGLCTLKFNDVNSVGSVIFTVRAITFQRCDVYKL